MDKLQVEKMGGQTEDFDRAKLLTSLQNAGANEGMSNEIASRIQAWARENAENDVIKSSDIRTKVIELLRQMAPAAAKAYEEYKK